MPGGKLQERRASRFSFFVYMTTRNGDPRARGSLLLQKKCTGILAPGRAHLTNSVCLVSLDKLFISRHIRHIKNKNEVRLCFA